MKALVYTNTCTMQYGDEPEPQAAQGQVKVKIHATAICGSDMHAYHGHDPRRVPPLILGHEVCGEAMNGAHAGKLVVLNPLMSCGYCLDCQSGRSNLCAERELIGMYLAGAYAEYVVIDERNVLPVPTGLSAVHAALTEPVATALHAIALVERVSYRPLSEQKCLVLGGGAIGLLCMLILRSKGVNAITLAETNPLRAQTVVDQGGVKVVNPMQQDLSQGELFDVVFDCVGCGPTRQTASACVSPGGIISHVGLQDSAEGLDIRRITLQEITLLGNYCYTMADLQASLDLLATGKLGDLDWLERRPLSDGAQAFDDLHHGRVAAAKIILQPDAIMGA